MAVIEGGVSGSLVGVGAEASNPMHIVTHPYAYGAGGWYRIGASSGTVGAALAANSELFQFRYVTAASRVAVIGKVVISAGLNVAATAAGLMGFRMTVARSWTAAGSGGTRLNLTGNNTKLRTAMATSEVSDIGISTTAALTAGTKTLDTTDIGAITVGIGTGALTTVPVTQILAPYEIFNPMGDGGHPLVLAHQEGFVIRSNLIAPATMTWGFSVNVIWAEVPAF